MTLLTLLLVMVGDFAGGQQGMMIMLIFSLAMNFYTYWNSDKVVLAQYRAHQVDENSAPALYGIVKRLAQRANLPMPKVYIIDDQVPNAFATGRNPQHAAVAVTTALMMVVIIFAAYAFARLDFPGKNLVFALFLSLMMIPSELVIITNFVTITNWGMRNTFWGLILPSVTSVFYIYLLKENFEQIPDELYKAAKVDGTSDLKYLFKVMLPIAQPTVVTIVILKVIECWNSYVWPRLITDDEAYFLVSNGIQEIRENGFGRENIPAMMAAVVVISVPLIVLFLVFHKKIMAGVSRGGTKG